RRPINLGDHERVRAVERAWGAGEEVRGWALYWAMVHDYLARLLEADDRVRSAALVVRYEEMCDSPVDTLTSVFRHYELPDAEPLVARFAPGVTRPDYYASPFTAEEVTLIREVTAGAAAQWGYR